MPLLLPQSRVRSAPSVPSQRSPLKKHLQLSKSQYAAAEDGVETRASSPARSPLKLKTLVAANANTSSPSTSAAPAPPATTTSLKSKTLRASMLHVLLTLMDHEDAVLEQHVLPVLQHLATLRLENADVQRECLRALRRVSQSTAAPSSSSSSTPSPAPGARRNSGRAKSRVDLRHCKEFLLACANEIHELEDVNPSFDYAEDTTSEAPRGPRAHASHEQLKSRRVARRAMFDYVSVVDGSLSSMDTEDDDADADQGTQLSEVLIRAEEVARECSSSSEDLEREDLVVCRRAFSQWRDATAGGAKRQRDARALATKFRAFSALKSHRAASRRSLSRKQRGLRQLKAAVAVAKRQKQQTQTQTQTQQTQPSPARPSAVERQRWLPRVSWELALALIVAAVVHSAM